VQHVISEALNGYGNDSALWGYWIKDCQSELLTINLHQLPIASSFRMGTQCVSSLTPGGLYIRVAWRLTFVILLQ
jgi:hypothetical protein